jgi:ferredoxin
VNGEILAARRVRILFFIHNAEAAMAKLSITVNKTRCIGSGECVETAPAVFQLGADGKSEVVNPTGAGDSIIVLAARSCPVKAITVVDEDAGVQLFPPPKK